MSFDVFLNFDGDCRAALDFYADVFLTGKPAGLMTYGQSPNGCSVADKDRILYASLPIFGHSLMFSDCPSGEQYVKGSNVALTLGSDNTDEIHRIFVAMSVGGEIFMPLEKTFFSELYGMVRDKFDITWQLSLTAFEGATSSFNELANARYSVRSFKLHPIGDEKIAAILEAGRIAPTACNYQPQRIKVITGGDLEKVDACSPCRFGAPTVLLVCYDKNISAKRSSFDNKELGEIDVSIVTTHLMFAAHEQGLGSCWVAHF
ncbi:MAG: nitroreductase family protein [Oscillospiraceae bacterium]|nr:nitroreductase family protein [Oscillospiraceae bacterium]